MRTPWLLAAPVFTARRTRLAVQQHEHRAVAHRRRGHDHAPASARRCTVGSAASRRQRTPRWRSSPAADTRPGLPTFTFTCTVAFWRLASGEISLMKPSYLRSGKASVVTTPCCRGVQLGEIVLADVELHFQIVQIGQRDHVALGAAIAHETGGDEFALLHGALQNRAGHRRADDGVARLRLGVGHHARACSHLAAQRIDLLLARAELDQFVASFAASSRWCSAES